MFLEVEEPPGSWFLVAAFQEKGRHPPKNALAQWVPGHGVTPLLCLTHPAPVSTPLTSTQLLDSEVRVGFGTQRVRETLLSIVWPDFGNHRSL